MKKRPMVKLSRQRTNLQLGKILRSRHSDASLSEGNIPLIPEGTLLHKRATLQRDKRS